MATLGGPSGSSPLRSNGSHDGQAGRWLDWMTRGQRHSKLSQAQGELPGSSPLRSDGSHGSQTRDWTDCLVAKSTQMRVENDSRQPGYLLKNRHSESLKERLNLLFLKDVEEMRCCRWRWRGENHNSHRLVLHQARTEEPYIWTQYLQSDVTIKTPTIKQ